MPVFTRKFVLAGETISGLQPMTMHLVESDPNGNTVGNIGDIAFLSGGLTRWECLGGSAWRGIGSGGGGSSTVNIISIPFTYATRTLLLAELIPGSIVSECRVYVNSAWNLPGAALQIGTPSDPSALMHSEDLSLYQIAQYDAGQQYKATITELLQLTLTGPSTTGSGEVVVTYKQ